MLIKWKSTFISIFMDSSGAIAILIFKFDPKRGMDAIIEHDYSGINVINEADDELVPSTTTHAYSPLNLGSTLASL